jgi:synaptic vesicle membrane protein VAT-1
MFGGYSSLIVVPESQIFLIPKQMGMNEAAGFLTIGLTAYYAVYELFKFKSTEFQINRVMVHSAAGGVGGMIVQMAKNEGSVVVGVVGMTEKVFFF